MNKKEFLDILYEQLSGQMPEGNVAAHVQYYRNYIEEEQHKGRSEGDILNELGDPHADRTYTSGHRSCRIRKSSDYGILFRII